jgi:signal transduction histidine kinase
MDRVLGCVFEQHDLRLVVLAGLLCLFACASALSMIWRANVADGWARNAWIAAAGVVAGCGIWGTHFVAMLAYETSFAVSYDPGLTILSALIAMTMCGVGFAFSLSRLGPLFGGAVTGAAIGTMHYVGMAAVRSPADAVWDWRYVTASVVLGIVMNAVGMNLAIKRGTLGSYGIGAIFFTLAICTMHFTGMTAVVYKFNPTIAAPLGVMDPFTLAVAVAASAVLIVALGLIGALVDSHLAQRASGEARRLRTHIAELEATKSALEQTSQNLTVALDAAAAANHAKSSFLASMSHELRTPLNAVIGFAEMMTTEAFGPLGNKKYRDYASDIRSSGIHLLTIINDILDISRIDSGEGRLEEEVLDLRLVISQSLRMVAHQAELSTVELKTTIEPGLPRMRGDKRRLKQVLINLLANAVKFTPAGGRVSVRAWREDERIAVSVSDTGIGIPKKDLQRALERFGQVDGRLARKYEGVGLGLPLATELMKMHGGSLTLESAENVGTTVTVFLPRSRIVDALIVAAE